MSPYNAPHFDGPRVVQPAADRRHALGRQTLEASSVTRRIHVNRVVQLLAAFIAVTGPLQATESHAAGLSESEKEIRSLEETWNTAHLQGDHEALDRIWAADLPVVVPEMPVFSKADLLSMWKSVKVSFTKYTTSEMSVRVYESAAVTTGRLHRARDFGGQKRSEDWIFTKFYARLDGKWRVVAYHASPLPTQ